MTTYRIALANLRFPATPEDSVSLAEEAIDQAGKESAGIVCFPECFVPGYRGRGATQVPPADSAFLRRAWSTVASAAAKAKVGVVLGTERLADHALFITALVINPDGAIAGFQDKVQLDPSEEATYSRGAGRRVFQIGPLTFGSPSVTRAGGIRKRCVGRLGGERRWFFIPISTLPSRVGMWRHALPILPTASMRKPCFAARRRTLAISRP